MARREAVVFVHGIWMTGVELSLLRHRVKKAGYDTYQFHYPSLRCSPRANAAKLDKYLRSIKAGTIHLVAHSLGGIVLMHLFASFPQQKPGRVVMLGTPARGSQVAHLLNQRPLLHYILGAATQQGLLGDVPVWPDDRELGLIVGTRQVGLGMVLTAGKLAQPNDGTVSLTETAILQAKDVFQLEDTHFTMLIDKRTAQAVINFLCSGRFIT
ncbi:MAG: alpha/beta hydrolase [Gammaproteobacteria bacterium]|nr:alpha/beta hydrolase [Gammaproteobacteria bacterium]